MKILDDVCVMGTCLGLWGEHTHTIAHNNLAKNTAQTTET